MSVEKHTGPPGPGFCTCVRRGRFLTLRLTSSQTVLAGAVAGWSGRWLERSLAGAVAGVSGACQGSIV